MVVPIAEGLAEAVGEGMMDGVGEGMSDGVGEGPTLASALVAAADGTRQLPLMNPHCEPYGQVHTVFNTNGVFGRAQML